MTNETVDIKALFSKKRARENKRLEIFNRILIKCHDRIKIVGQLEQTYCTFVIPRIIVGMPMYKLEDCRKYLVSKLKKNGFQVEIQKEDELYISWEHHDI